jgi:hypothetical protein
MAASKSWIKRLLLLILCAIDLPLLAQQTEVFGVVRDGISKELLPFVNVRFKGSLKAVQTDLNGAYRIRTSEKTDSILFSFLGYETAAAAVRRGKTQELNVDMGSGKIQLTEVLIKEKKRRKREIDTAALYVLAQVIRNKPMNDPAQLESYHFEGYTKLSLGLLNAPDKFINRKIFRPFRFVFDNIDTTKEGNIAIPGLIKETITHEWHRRKPEASRREVISDIVSGVDHPSLSNLVSWQLRDLEIYKDQHVLIGHGFLLPFATGCRAIYRYYLTDTQLINGRVSYKLNFLPKSKDDIAFSGYAWIDSASWAVVTADLTPAISSNINYLNEYTVRQEFRLLSSGHWALCKEEMAAVASLFRKEKNKLSLLVRKTTVRRDIQANPEVSDTLFKSNRDILRPGASSMPRAYWDTARFIPLESQEARIYTNSDTIKTVPAWKRYQWLINMTTTAFLQTGPVEFGRFYQFVSRNNIEGTRLRMGLRTTRRFSKTFHFYGYGAYGLRDKRIKYEMNVRIMLPRPNNNWHAMGFMYRYDLNQLGQLNQLITFDNALTLLLPARFNKIMLIRQFDATYEREWFRDFSTSLSYSQKVFYPIPGVFDFTRKSEAGGLPEQIGKFRTTEFVTNARYCYKDKYFEGMYYRYYVPSGYPSIDFTYTMGVPRLAGGDYHYHKMVVNISQRLATRAGFSYYSLWAGGILGKVPYPSWFVTAGSFGWFYNRFNYALLKEFEFVSDRYVALWWDHYFDGYFLNKIPWVSKLQLREHVSFKMLWGDFSPARAALVDLPAGINQPARIPYMEIGFGLGNIAKIFRIDFVWRLTYRDTPGAPNFGVRVGIAPTF